MQLLLLVLLGSAAARQDGAESPVDKVVSLLQDLQARITKDGDAEQQVYDKYACWCEKTTQRKAAMIEGAREQIRTLGQEVLKQKGTIATRTAEIEQLTADIKENEEAQEEATTIRQKENAEYQAETAEMQQALAALQKAVIVLGGATSSLLQRQGGQAEANAEAVRAFLAAMPARAAEGLAPEKLAQLQQASTTVHRAGYAPQSSTIQGILTDMYSTFASDLETTTQDEATKNNQFEGFIAAKQRELLTMQKSLQKKVAQKAEAESMLAEATQAYDDTEKQLKADIEFFDATKAACGEKSEEWDARKTLRTEELKGIKEALEILTSDEAKELFGKSFKPGVQGFLQVVSISSAGADASSTPEGKAAYNALKASASKAHSLRLATLAAHLRLAKVGHFDKVLEAIDTMIQTLRDEGAADIEKRDQCKEENQKLTKTIADLDWKIENNEAQIRKLEDLIEKRTAEKAEAIEDIADVVKQIKTMEDTRVEENGLFVQGKIDDEQAIELLKQAREKLAEYAKKHLSEKSFIEQGPEFEVSEDQAPDAKFSRKGSRGGESKGVVAIMDMLIEDLSGEIRASVKDEGAAQLSFEKSVKAAKKLKEELEAKVVNLEQAIADRKEEKTQEQDSLETNKGDLTEQEARQAEIKPDCDSIAEFFAERVKRRTAEMEGLSQAKDFLAGYQAPEEAKPEFGALLQDGAKPFDDKALARVDFTALAPSSPRPLRARRA